MTAKIVIGANVDKAIAADMQKALSALLGTDVPVERLPYVEEIGARWPEFIIWATEGGYDESYFNTKDSKCEALYEQFLEETDTR